MHSAYTKTRYAHATLYEGFCLDW